ncbi:metallophosphoesterase [candidate division KSB1 bacterium]|nr:metallophosphoesterase [candidate division KSB1 bacterium]
MSDVWSKSEIEELQRCKAEGKSDQWIADQLRRPYRSVTSAIRRYCKQEETDWQEQAAHWKRVAIDAQRDLAAAQKERTAIDILVEQVHDLAPKSYAPPKGCFQPPKKAKGTPQSALLILSDTHVGAVVKPEQTLGLGEYNFEIFLRRLWRLQCSIFSILQDHTTTEVPEIVVAQIGDMLDGGLVHSAECAQVNTILAQFYSAGHALAQFYRNLSTIAPVRVHTCVGNHTRFQNQHKMPTKNRNSNFDQFLTLYVEALLRDCPRIKFNIDMQPFACFDVQGFNHYAGHGDNLRGGDKTLGIPTHAMGRMVSTTTQLFSRADRVTPHYYLLGHLHRPISIPHAQGEILTNGAFPGIDGYALGEYFNSSYPSQKFWLVHEKFGRSATYDLRLDFGDSAPHGYVLPDKFLCQ